MSVFDSRQVKVGWLMGQNALNGFEPVGFVFSIDLQMLSICYCFPTENLSTISCYQYGMLCQ